MKRFLSFVLLFVMLLQCFAFSAVAAVTFEDVAPDAYYAEAVVWAVEKGITSGTSETTFSPRTNCTRAQAMTFIWRALGSPEPVGTELAFVDVAPDAYYFKPVLWAVENGITGGTSATEFSPRMECTRAQIVTFLWIAKGKPVVETTNPFTDVPEEKYYYNAVLWAVENGITAGISATSFGPGVSCTRAQIVTFLYACFYEEAHEHIFGEWTVTAPATCAAEGSETRECACGETETRAIPVIDHTWSEWAVTVPATCAAEGTESRECACGETETRAIPVIDHIWGEWVVVTPPTETEEGREEMACSVCGSTTVRPIPVVTYDPFVIFVQPESYSAYVGGTAVYAFEVDGGKAPYTYEWQVRNDDETEFRAITAGDAWATDYDTNYMKVTVIDEMTKNYQFRCIATDARGETAETDVVDLVVLFENPEIATQPESVEGSIGDTVSFGVSVIKGLAPFSYRWQFIDQGAAEYSDIPSDCSWAYGMDTDTLSVDVYTDQLIYNRMYRCVITDAQGREVVSNGATVYVKYDFLEVTDHPMDVQVSSGEKAVFSAMVGGGIAPYNVKWQYRIGDDGEWTDFTSADNGWATDYDFWDLYIDTAAAGFDKDYRFRAVFSDALGNTIESNEARYTEYKHLSIATQPEDAYVDPYESATFTVKVKDGLPSYYYQWYMRMDGMPMFTEITESDSWISGANSDTINVTLNPDDLENNVRFYCAVSDEYGDTVESNVVYPRARLRLTVEPGSVGVVAPLQQIYFDIAVDGGTAPYTYKWEYMYDLYPDTWIEESTETSGYQSVSHAMAFVGGMLEKNLMIRCTVTDAAGQSVSTKGTKLYNANTLQPLTINDRSPDYTNIDPGETAYFWVHPAGGIKPYEYQWQYRYNYQTQFNDLDGENGSTFDVLTTEYDRKYEVEYRCIVTDALGNEVVSDVMGINFNLWFDYSDNTFAVSEGTTRILYADPKGGTAPLSYKWEVYSTIENMWFPLSAILLSDVTANNASLTVKVSKVVAKYYPKFRCIVTDADGNSAYTPERGFILNDPAFITDLPETYNVEKTGDRVTLKVTLNEYAKTPIKYYVEYTNDNYSGWATIDVKSGQGVSYETSYIVGTSDRDNNTRYRIVAVDADGRTVTSKEMAVIFPIRVVSYTKDRPLDVGNSTTFTVSVANGRSPYSYEWYYATESGGEYKKCIDSTEPFTGEKTSTLSVTSIKDYMKSYSVKCVITDADGKTVESTAAVFTVMPLKITSQPVSVVASKGSYFTFKGLKVSGGDGELSYKWQYAQNRSPKESDFSNCFLAPAYFTNHDTNELTVFFNTGFEKGTFRCIISDKAGNVVYSDYVYVNLP